MTSLNYLLQGIGVGESMRDFRHASKIFVDNNYELAPKQQFLYYVFFEISQSAKLVSATTLKQVLPGLLVKAVDLPKYRMDFKAYNAYNKKDYLQTKINYEPVTITLHDDNANVIRDLWRSYYSYYYRDMDYGDPGSYDNTYKTRKYEDRTQDRWGYSPRLPNGEEFFNTIKIYSLSQKQYSLYTLINPKIENFEHGRHEAAAGAGVMEHTMRINYETVNYDTGFVTPGGEPKGMTDRYDNQPSPLTPLGGGTRSITGQGGLIDTLSAASSALARGNPAEAAFLALRASQNFKGYHFGAGAAEEATGAINNAIRTAGNSSHGVAFPTIAQVLPTSSTSTQSTISSIGSQLLAVSNGESIVTGF